MKRERVIRPGALAEIDHQAAYLAAHANEAVADRFLAAVDATVTALLNGPGVGSVWVSDHPRLQGICKRRVVGFANYLLFYRYDDAIVDVLYLFHGAQDIEARLHDDVDDN